MDESSSNLIENAASYDSGLISPEQASLIWQKLCAVNQRLLLGKAVENKLMSHQIAYPTEEKLRLAKSLNDEMVMLHFVKQQLEEAIMRYFSQEIALNEFEHPHSEGNLFTENSNLSFPLTHLETPNVSSPVPQTPKTLDPNEEVEEDTSP